MVKPKKKQTWYDTEKTALKTEANYSESGKVHGQYTEWYKNGQIREQGMYKGEMMDGEWRKWFSDGQLRERSTYMNDRSHGNYTEWYPNGQMKRSGSYMNGKSNGEWAYWYENGNAKMVGSYTRGLMSGIWLEWNDNGTLKSQTAYEEDQLDGESKVWYQNGKLKQQSCWKNDEQDGEMKIWYGNGQLSKKSSYKNGVIEGMWEKWYPNGQLLEQGMYENGKKDGEWSTWDNDGQLAENGYYKKGKKVGEWKIYSEGVESTTKYVMGRVDPEHEYKDVLQGLVKSKNFKDPFETKHAKKYKPISTSIFTILNLPPDLLAPIKYYTFHGDGWINQCLLKGECVDFVRTLINTIDDIFEKMPPLSEPLTVYRGVKKEYGLKNVLNYTSTSLLRSKASDFAGSKGVVWTITVSAGTKIIPLEPITIVASEHEILLPRNGSMFKTTATDLVYVPVGWQYTNDI